MFILQNNKNNPQQFESVSSMQVIKATNKQYHLFILFIKTSHQNRSHWGAEGRGGERRPDEGGQGLSRRRRGRGWGDCVRLWGTSAAERRPEAEAVRRRRAAQSHRRGDRVTCSRWRRDAQSRSLETRLRSRGVTRRREGGGRRLGEAKASDCVRLWLCEAGDNVGWWPIGGGHYRYGATTLDDA
jgi:hypothetical protein